MIHATTDNLIQELTTRDIIIIDLEDPDKITILPDLSIDHFVLDRTTVSGETVIITLSSSSPVEKAEFNLKHLKP